MCIALLSSAHPSYRLILIDNRDEYLNRPTAVASWWPGPHSKVLGGRDLHRSVQGTWLGIAKNGKIAVLTNFREPQPPDPSAVSRGAIIRKWLTEDYASTEAFSTEIIESGIGQEAGGFSLVCGRVGEKLAVLSNRAKSQSQVPWVCGDVVQTVGISNTAFQDRSWKKVLDGEELMLDAIRESVKQDEGEDALIKRFLRLLSTDNLPRFADPEEGGLETFINELRNTILVPPLGRRDLNGLPPSEIAAARKVEVATLMKEEDMPKPQKLGVSGIYGTQKQTVLLVDHKNHVRFFERTLFDADSTPIAVGKGDFDVTFEIETVS